MTAASAELRAGTTRWHMLALLAITIAGFAIRVIGIDRWPLWGDEALTLLIAQWPYHYLFLAPVDPTPGLYYALHKLLLGPMVSAAGARSISLVCGTLLIPATYWLAKEARVPALLSAALVALSFPLIDYSQEARAYSLLVLLVTCSAACFVRWSRTREQKHLWLTLLFGILSFYTHLVAIFWLGPMLLAVIWVLRRDAVMPVLIFALMAVPEVKRLLGYQHEIFSWLAQATPAQAMDTLGRALLPFRPVGYCAVLAVLLIGLASWFCRSHIHRWCKENAGASFAVATLAAAPIAIWLFGFAGKPIFMTRTILIAVPGFMLFAALLAGCWPSWARYGAVAAYAASLFLSGTTRPKEDWRTIADKVGVDTVLMCQPSHAAALGHAMTGNGRMLVHYPSGIAEIVGPRWPIAFDKAMRGAVPIAVMRPLATESISSATKVWPVLSGSLSDLPSRPTMLTAALSSCDARQDKNSLPRYSPD